MKWGRAEVAASDGRQSWAGGRRGLEGNIPRTHEPSEVFEVGIFEVEVWGDGEEGRVAGDIDDSNGTFAGTLGGC